MKYLKYFESNLPSITSIPTVIYDKCVVLVYKKTGIDKFSGKCICERSEEKKFIDKKDALEKAILWSKEKIKDDSIGGIIIYKSIRNITKDGNMLRWWSTPNSIGMFCNTTKNPDKDASNLSRYLFGMTQAYLIFGKDYPDQHRLCNIIRAKAPKSWQSIQNIIDPDKSIDMNNAADMDQMGFGD
jgi:hypothetical protein